MRDETTVHFTSHGDACVADLFLPDRENPPVVVMAHGFGATRRMKLPEYARRFREKGLATFLFDYRGFGESEGSPRQLIDPDRHVQDWVRAIDAARGLAEVDGDRLGVWGTSFSGGHVLEAASLRDVGAVAIQIPFVDGWATTWHLMRDPGVGYVLRATGEGLLDAAGRVLGRSPRRVPIVGPPPEFALLNTPGALEGYESLIPKGASWENAAPARIALKLPWYRPAKKAPAIEAPVHLTVATEDKLVPPSASLEMATRIDDVQVRREPGGHFEVYHGDRFERIVEEQAVFLAERLEA